MFDWILNWFNSLSGTQHWKPLLVGLATLAATVTPTPLPISPQTINNLPQAPNIGISSNTSRNWSGYTATQGSFTSVSGTWTIARPTSNGHTSADAAWVGIGGISSSDLIQAGTQNIVNGSNQVTSEAFYELLPNISQSIPVTVTLGDSVSVSISQQSTNQWQISFTDNTNGQSYANTFNYTSSASSAEWIEEEPSNGNVELPLDNFGTVSFTNALTTENGNNVNVSESNAQPIIMANGNGQILAIPSSVGSDGASFTATRTNAASSSPIPEFDRNPRGFRRQGNGIGNYYIHKGNRNWITPSVSPTETITPTPTPTPLTPTFSQNPWNRWFQLHLMSRRHF